MCFHSKQSKDATTLEHRFQAKFDSALAAENSRGIYNGFERPRTPIISNDNDSVISLAQWGLLPKGVNLQLFKANTLNARMETLGEKVSFKMYVQNRCLILVDGFWEWRWLDEKGKVKEKHLISLPDERVFAFAGLYSDWTDENSGEVIRTYTVVTTKANASMEHMHAYKKDSRMPLILEMDNERDWLKGMPIREFEVCPVEVMTKVVG